MRTETGHSDRLAGTLLGLATGDALGAGYEFAAPPEGDAEMIGGGLGCWEPGEWTDDTQMAVCVAETLAARGLDLDGIGRRFLDWYASGPADVGNQTSAVLGGAASPGDLSRVAADYVARNPGAGAGNGSLMRTAPVALAFLGDDEAIASAARAVSELTHGDPLAGDACVLWCIAIDRAVREERLDGARDGLLLLEPGADERWAVWLDAAEREPLRSFRPNGFVVTALQAAHGAIWQTPVPDDRPRRHLELALQAAVSVGDDTDTVAAIAGALLGARWGAAAVPGHWRRLVHGWPGLTADDLVTLAERLAAAPQPGSRRSPSEQ
jgi:ADP-ribosylglycohydrolase